MAPFFANQSCDPFQPRSRGCELGNYVRYAVNATSTWDVSAAVIFARLSNVRIVIRNTGHDYLGRSTGAGSVGIWVHNMKDISIIDDYQDAYYQGKAMKVGAGVQGFEALEAARNVGLTVVGGECPTVGLAGGFTQGGGHSALSTSFGLAADNVLEYEVVTASGRVTTASRSRNSDLYFALSGGGGGNWGVVTAMTIKAYEEKPTSGVNLVFFANENPDGFYEAIQVFHEEVTAMVDAGAMVVYYFSSDFFQIAPLTAFDKTEDQVRAMMKPMIDRLDAMNLKYSATFSSDDSYYNHYDRYFGPLPAGNIQVGIAQYGGRLIPRNVIANISSTHRFIAEQGVTWIGVATDVSAFGGSHNSVLPSWRNAIVHATLTTPWSFTAPWEDMIALQDLMTDIVMPAIEKVTPGSGVYMNEADFRQPNFQDVFFGANYARLKQIKKKWDPQNLFYVLNGVGSEDWVERGDGRLCKA